MTTKPLKRTSRFRYPLTVRRVHGHSMLPTLKPGQLVFFSSLLSLKHGDVVIALVGEKEYVKRLLVNGASSHLVGDNSTDSKDLHGQDAFVVFGRALRNKKPPE